MNPQSNLHKKTVMGTVWWSAASLIPYSFLNPGETITSGKYAQESMRCTENYNTYSQQWSTERAQFFSMTTSNHTSHNQNFKSWMNWAMKFYLICRIHLTSYNHHFFKHLKKVFFAGKTLLLPAGGRKCFQRVCQIPKHRFLCYRNKHLFLIGTNVLIVMVPIFD